MRFFRMFSTAALLCILFAMLAVSSSTPASAVAAAATRKPTSKPTQVATDDSASTPAAASSAIDDDSFPTQIDPTGGNVKLIVKRLVALKIVPTGGKQLIAVSDSFGTTSDPGYTYLRIGQGTQIQDMVLQFEMGWQQMGVGSACGMVFRAVNSKLDNYWSFGITQDHQISLAHIENKTNTVAYTGPTDNFVKNKFNYVTIIALNDKVAVYLNGALEIVKVTTGTVDAGVFALDVYNDENATDVTTTDCRYQNIWAWSYDS